jgi:2-polyprenyl-3-methyl-5-hydroxy-6-metoxy-1,4-benzoquinol methylase
MYQSADFWQEFYRRLETKARELIDPSTGMVRQSLVAKVPCPNCRSADAVARIIVNGFNYVTCTQCGLVFLNPQLTDQALRDMYNDGDVRKFFFEKLLLPFGERDQRPDFQQRAKFLRSLIENSSPQLLDIGCAAGNFLEIAGAAGFHCEGLELNEMYIDYIRLHRPSIKVADKRLEEMNYPPEYFDAVTLWDVLEHLPRPNDVLQEIARILKPGGILGFSTINHACINERLLRSRWRYYMPPDHVCSFTPKLLISMLRTHGFSIISMRHHYMFEVLFDSAGGWLHLSKKNTTLAAISNKIRKVLFSLMARGSELIFNALRSGDLLTVYARKNDQERITP